MGTVIVIIVILVILFVINQVRKNERADNLMKAHGLPLEDRQFLMKKYGPSGIDKWMIMKYMTDKSKQRFEENFEDFIKSEYNE